MNILELRDILFEMIQGYFAGAIVEWGKATLGTKPQNPFICLTMGDVKRPQHFITEVTDEATRSLIPSTVPLKVELFTNGREVKDEDDDIYYEDTSMADMIDFVNYMVSPEADDYYERIDISITPEGDVKDSSAVRDDNYEYRAFQLFTVSFMDVSEGYAGISRRNWKPTASGGGTAELANKQIMDVDNSKIDIEQE